MATLTSNSLDNCTSIPDFIPAGTRMTFHSRLAPNSWTKESTLNNNRALRVTTGTAAPFGAGTVFNTVFPTTSNNKPVGGTMTAANATDSFQSATVAAPAGLGQFNVYPQLSVNAHTITLGEMWLHDHTYQQRPNSAVTIAQATEPNPRSVIRNQNEDANFAQSPLGTTSHTHAIPATIIQHSHTISASAHSHTISSSGPHSHGFQTTVQDFNIKYVDIIICIKN